MGTKTVFETMPWPAIEARARRCDIAIIPFGSLEAQPPHLPAGADTFIIEALCQQGAALVAEDVGALVMPAFDVGSPVGPSLTPQALNLPWDVLMEVLVGVLADLYRQRFRRFVLVNGHGSTGVIQTARPAASADDGGRPRMSGEGFSYQTAFGFAYDAAAQFVENGPDAEIFFVSAGGFFRGMLPTEQAAWWQSSGEGDLPLPVKTAILLALRPDLVDLAKMPADTSLYSPYRFLGDPRYAVGAVMVRDRYTQSDRRAESFEGISAETGTRLIAIWTEKFAAMLREMQAQAHLAGRYRPDAYKSGQP